MIAVITDEFRKTLRKLNDKDVNKKVLEAVENVENAQTKQDIRGLKKLSGYKNAYRIRIGDYRIGIHILNEIVHFNRVASRKDIYDEFP
jgi:mRNA interferase RelE/StbE